MNKTVYACFDIGGTDIKASLLDEEGHFTEKERFSTNGFCGQTILRGMNEFIGSHKESLAGIAISAPGFIDPFAGTIRVGGAIRDFDGFAMKAYFQEKWRLPVSVENDVNCVALAEQWNGNGQGVSDFLCFTVGTGIGGAIVIGGNLYRGVNFQAGEFGYMVSRGIQTTAVDAMWSRIGSLYSIRRVYALEKNIPVEEVSGEQVFQAKDEGDPIATQIITSFYETIALGIYNLTYMFNPEKILIGGGITSRGKFLEEVFEHVRLLGLTDTDMIEICAYQNDAGMIGAWRHHLNMYEGKETETHGRNGTNRISTNQ